MKNVMAVGDSRNDLMMIKEAGLGVAMGNAQDIVKNEADWITATNEEDGVAKAIQKWVLK
jgi:hydroxymethylpyrimidine pyrophosphatase-like HAD family hydrolase